MDNMRGRGQWDYQKKQKKRPKPPTHKMQGGGAMKVKLKNKIRK